VGLLRALAAILARLGRDAEGAAIGKRIALVAVTRMGLAVEDRAAALAFELALAGLGPVPPSMPRGYGAALFDAYASAFDVGLREQLLYRAPELVYAALTSALGARRDALDLCDVGCGTGLLGPLLRPIARRMDGVDHSRGMLERARALGVYDDLLEGDLTSALTSRPDAYDVVTAADVLVYIGELSGALGAMRVALRTGGLAAFSVEGCDDDGYRLSSTGRYQHGPSFVREVAAAVGLAEVSMQAVVLREERSRPVAGVVWVLRKGPPAVVA